MRGSIRWPRRARLWPPASHVAYAVWVAIARRTSQHLARPGPGRPFCYVRYPVIFLLGAAMAGRPLTVLFMPESAYGPTNNCIGIGKYFDLHEIS